MNIILIVFYFTLSGSNSVNEQFVKTVLDECHKTFVSCYHAFYPTAYLKWTLLCELLSDIDKVTFVYIKFTMSNLFNELMMSV